MACGSCGWRRGHLDARPVPVSVAAEAGGTGQATGRGGGGVEESWGAESLVVTFVVLNTHLMCFYRIASYTFLNVSDTSRANVPPCEACVQNGGPAAADFNDFRSPLSQICS